MKKKVFYPFMVVLMLLAFVHVELYAAESNNSYTIMLQKESTRIDDAGKISWDNDFDKKCTEPSFMNDTCRRCKFLPACYGVCPRDHTAGQHYCKLDSGMGIETKIRNYIDFRYDHIADNTSE